jgi:CheY-like chemotaxis protein
MRAVWSRPSLESIPLALIVDAHVDIQELYTEILSGVVQVIVCAADGAEALAFATERRPQLVLTETRVPGVDGLALCAALRADPRTARTSIIVVTADFRPEVVARAKRAGADAVLQKPASAEMLIEIISRLATSGRTLPGVEPADSTTASASVVRSDFSLLPPDGEVRRLLDLAGHVVERAREVRASADDASCRLRQLLDRNR